MNTFARNTRDWPVPVAVNPNWMDPPEPRDDFEAQDLEAREARYEDENDPDQVMDALIDREFVGPYDHDEITPASTCRYCGGPGHADDGEGGWYCWSCYDKRDDEITRGEI